MDIRCPSCTKKLGTVSAVDRLILTVHCPYDGYDFGVAVDPEPKSESVPDATGNSTPAAS